MKLGVDCVKCKGRLMCGLPHCPILEKMNTANNLTIKKEFKSETPGVFIGWHGYPNVYAGILTPTKKLGKIGPREWVNENAGIIDVMNYRTNMINSRQKTKVNNLNEYIQSSALANKPLSVDVLLNKVPELKIAYNIHAQPIGPSAELKKLTINDDLKIKKPIQKAHYDTDFKAKDAMLFLKKKRIEEYEISSLLSAGTLGEGKNRKLVPTRWSITATDDTISKEYIKTIKQQEIIDQYIVLHGRHLGNIFTILLMPRMWSYELFELWMPGAVFNPEGLKVMTDYEGYNGRKKYAENCGGGYYASRLPITEWLIKQKCQASALVIRQITKDYYMPLGVWVVREAVRKALNNTKTFNDYASAKLYVERITGFDLRRSKLIRQKQTTLNSFITNPKKLLTYKEQDQHYRSNDYHNIPR